MIISEHQYAAMCREAQLTLENAWGKEKFQEWYEATIIPLNGKVYLDYHSYYLMLKVELDNLLSLYSMIFLAEEADYQEQMIMERPF